MSRARRQPTDGTDQQLLVVAQRHPASHRSEGPVAGAAIDAVAQASATSSRDLAELAAKAKPGLLVLYHQLLWTSSEEELLNEVRKGYKGRVVSGRDLDIY